MNFLECNVCLHAFSNVRKPCVFACGHGCCEECFNEIKSSICHICRRPNIEKRINQAIFDIFKQTETYFATKQRKYLNSYIKIVPQISAYVSDATKQLKNYLSGRNMPKDVLEILIIQSKHDDDFMENISFENLCVISDPVFRIRSKSEKVVEENEVRNLSSFIYKKFFSISNTGIKWRNYYRRPTEFANQTSELMREAILNDYFEKEFCAYIALSNDNECLLDKKPIGCIFWIIDPRLRLTKFKIGQLVKLVQMPPREFTGRFNQHPIIYSENRGCHIIEFHNGNKKLEELVINTFIYLVDILILFFIGFLFSSL